MKTREGVVLLALAVLFGCDIGAGPKFVAPSASSVELSSHNGVFWIVPGSAVLEGGTLGPQQNLIYILVVCPSLSANGHGTGTEHQRRLNTYTSRWNTQNGEIAVRVTWDKSSDMVLIGSQRFDRTAGNTFVVIRNLNGLFTAKQLASPGPDCTPPVALEFIRNRMTNDTLIAAVHLAE
jgi:hypothetical protein